MSQRKDLDEQPQSELGSVEPSVSATVEPVAATPVSRRQALEVYFKKYTLCAVFASLGGFLFGFDTGT